MANISLVKICRTAAEEGNKRTDHNSHYVHIDGDGELKTNFNDVCYARITHIGPYLNNKNSKPGIKDARLFINQHLRKHTPKQKAALNAWFKWVLTESVWRHAFTNPKGNWKRDGLGLNVKKYSLTYLVASATALREGWEFIHATEMWHTLVKQGMNKAFAHIVSDNFTRRLDKGKGYYMGGTKGSHGCFSMDFGKEQMKRYINADVPSSETLKLPAIKCAKSYRGIHLLYSDAGGTSPVYTIFHKTAVKKGEGWNMYSQIDLQAAMPLLKQLEKELTS